MGATEIFLIALSLSLDCFAVSLSSGSAMKSLNLRQEMKMAFFFGFFQAIMPVIGWLAGLSLTNYISRFAPWLAFALLAAVGLKMLYESSKPEGIDCSSSKTCPFDTATLIILAMATSLDALAVGFTFSVLRISPVTPVIIIGLVTFIVSLGGIRLGYAGKHFFEKRMEKAAGTILILLGLKILIQSFL